MKTKLITNKSAYSIKKKINIVFRLATTIHD